MAIGASYNEGPDIKDPLVRVILWVAFFSEVNTRLHRSATFGYCAAYKTKYAGVRSLIGSD